MAIKTASSILKCAMGEIIDKADDKIVKKRKGKREERMLSLSFKYIVILKYCQRSMQLHNTLFDLMEATFPLKFLFVQNETVSLFPVRFLIHSDSYGI